MLTQKIYLPSYNWLLFIFYEVKPEESDQVLLFLEELGAKMDVLSCADDDLSGGYNNGISFTSGLNRCSVIAMGRTTSPAQFSDSLQHEVGHTACYICQEEGIPVDGEACQYLAGEIARRAWPISRFFLCESCAR